ncbi:HAD-IA family hydrolase [Pigmentibacter sp. JX0631]|uniref:HAD-IA family hydrolase n=1 Tax=Pigmentibacter sp. JX0631 TaxID=2976982 RepID=UPI0024697785|nr:HAD-IA family hydrolase [Pigmentibacter sp. JX0631]WGL59172.1 HAD-IA family hydrolase [Pigmentibacter sp. JX0631]
MKIAVFDFDGVIADSYKAILEVIKEISKIKNIPPLTQEDILNKSTKDLFKYLKIRWYEIPKYYKLAKKIVNLNKNLITLNPQITEMFQNLNKDKIEVIILSSNSTDLILNFVKTNLNYVNFKAIIGDVSLFKKSKKIKEVMKCFGIKNADMIYIGDEVRDVLAARKAEVLSIAVLWGKENAALLSKEKPNFIVSTGKELSEILNEFSTKKSS